MNLRDKLSPDQFHAVANTPKAAAIYVASASGGGFEMFGEVFSAAKLIDHVVRQEGEGDYGELVAGLMTALRAMSKDEIKALHMDYGERKDVAALRARVKAGVAEGWSAVQGMPGADGFARFVLDVGRAAAQAKTGGFLGLGGKSVVDAQEQAALDELAAIMGGASS